MPKDTKCVTLHPKDLAALIALQMKNDAEFSKPRLANVSGGAASARSLQQLSSWCADRWGAQAVAQNPEERSYDLPWVVLDHQKVSQSWGWNPYYSIEDILQDIAIFAEEQDEWISFCSS